MYIVPKEKVSLLIEIEGKVIIGKDDPLPFRCPDCRRLFEGVRREPGFKVRCPFCQLQTKIANFQKVKFAEIAEARIISYV